MNLKKYATLLLAASLILSGFCGCAATKSDNQQLPLKTAVYSNLTDEESRSLLRQGLSDAGVKENRIDTLFAKVDAFRADVKSEWLTKGFESAAPTETKYDPYEMQDAWMKKNGSFPGYNCRITAFSLFGDFVTAGANQPNTQGEDALFLDLETLSADSSVLCGDSTAKFCALFAPVNAANSTDVTEQVKALQAGWRERGISFADGKARLISVVLHDKFSDTDNTLFIGHVGILLPAENGEPLTRIADFPSEVNFLLIIRSSSTVSPVSSA